MSRSPRRSLVLGGVALAFLAVCIAYEPALRAPFVFDDIYLPFYEPDFSQLPLLVAIRGVRPLLTLTFWLNHRLSGLEPYSYHLWNLLFHFGSGVLVFLIVRRLLGWAGSEGIRREAGAAFAGGMFLLHPVQTESVAYVASRSENLSALFFLAAFALFLYRRSESVSWPLAAGVLALFGAAAVTKEHTAVLPALLLLTDYFWNPGFSLQGIRRNWRLYVPIAAGGALALRSVWNVLSVSDSAGFGLKDITWHQYLYTQGRAIWFYIRLFLLPYGQAIDHDFPMSRTIVEHGAIFGLTALAVLATAAVWYRRRYPLACYGFLTFLLLLAPTSSVVPIRDPVAEHRLYLPMLGLLLVALDLLRRWQAGAGVRAAAMAVVLIAAAGLTHQRNQVWSSPIALWEDAAAKAPYKQRVLFQLAFAYYERGRCDAAVRYFEKAAQAAPAEQRLLIDWALAYDCLNQPQPALAKLEQAATMGRTAHVYSLIGMVHGKRGNAEPALAALETAEKLDPAYDMTYAYRGNVYAATGQLEKAIAEFQRALALNARNDAARQGLAVARSQLQAPH